MFETVGVMAVSACILQMVYEKIEKQRPVVDYTEENKKFREQKEQEAKEWSVQILPYLEKEKEQRSEPPVICVEDLTMRFRIATNNVSGIKEYLIQTLRKQLHTIVFCFPSIWSGHDGFIQLSCYIFLT